MGFVKVKERMLTTLLIAGLLALPAAQAQTGEEAQDGTYTYLYGHLYTLHRTNSTSGIAIGPNPMNTAFPEGENDFDLNTRYSPFAGAWPMACNDVLSVALNCDPVYDVTSNEVWFYQYNGLVPFANTWEYGAAGFRNGLTADMDLLKTIHLDPSLPIQAEFTMSADQTAWQTLNEEGMREDGTLSWDLIWPYPSWNMNYGILPSWTLLSKVYAASPGMSSNDIIAQEDRPDNVTIVASGATEPFDMVSLPSQLGQVTYELRPDMGMPLVEQIPAGKVIWWWMDWYSDFGAAGKIFYGNNFAVYSGEFFPPTMGLPIVNPMDIEMVMPQFTDDNKLVIIALFNSPFGAYDVPLDSASFEIISPDGSVIATQEDDTVTWMQKAAREQQSLLGVSPEAALKRGQATWLWNYLAEEDIKPGDYTIRVRAENMQGKAAYKEAYFNIESGLGAGAVTSSLGGMFTFSKEDIKKLEECHGCHDAATGDLLEGVQNVTMAEAKAMQAAGELDVDGSDDASVEKKSPGIGVVALAMAALALCRRRI